MRQDARVVGDGSEDVKHAHRRPEWGCETQCRLLPRTTTVEEYTRAACLRNSPVEAAAIAAPALDQDSRVENENFPAALSVIVPRGSLGPCAPPLL